MERERRILSRVEILEWVDRVFSIPNKERNFTEIYVSRSLGRSPQYIKNLHERRWGITELMQVRLSRVIYTLGEPKRVDAKTAPIKTSRIPEEYYIKMAKSIAALPWELAHDLGIDTATISICKHSGVPKFYKKTFRRLYEKLTNELFPY